VRFPVLPLGSGGRAEGRCTGGGFRASSFLLFAKAVIIMELPHSRLGVTAIPPQSRGRVKVEELGFFLPHSQVPQGPGCIVSPLRPKAAGATVLVREAWGKICTGLLQGKSILSVGIFRK
jgi:hypothetical protein